MDVKRRALAPGLQCDPGMKLARWIFILVAAVALMAAPQDKKGGSKSDGKAAASATRGCSISTRRPNRI